MAGGAEAKRPHTFKQSENHRTLAVLPSVGEELLKEVERLYKEKGAFTDEILLALHSVFGPCLEKALDLFEKNCITYFKVKSGVRYLIQVTGSNGFPYVLLPHVNYCPCMAYRYHVVGVRSHTTCKHVLAARLAEATGRGKEVEVSGPELTKMLLSAAKIEKE